MSAFTLANITRRLTQLSLRSGDNKNKLLETFHRPVVKTTRDVVVVVDHLSPCLCTAFHNSIYTTASRSFTSSSLLGKNEPAGISESDKQWNDWQQSLLNNFSDNDSTLNVSTKKRGGKTLRKRKEAVSSTVSLSSQERLIDAGPGQFPPLRYSDEETERLLKEAYEKIPARSGKRGTRSFKRQKVRFMKIRKARSIKKMEKVRHHFDRMEKRSAKVKAIQRMKEIAVESRKEDRLYQESVLKKWAAINNVAIKSTATAVV